ncbi:MAG: glycosyl hydrolase 115 family protein [Chitinophagaceae bacterium]
MRRILTIATITFLSHCTSAQSIVLEQAGKETFELTNAVICVDPADVELVGQSALLLQSDLEMVTGIKIPISATVPTTAAIIIGSADKSSLIRSAAQKGIVNLNALKGKWETYQIRTTDKQIIITGSDRRGTAFGVFELSRQLGVSPWYWWADVPVKKKERIYIKRNTTTSDAPRVKYRGIFINDEAPALSGWTKEKFGGFNHGFYEKVFELILRLKGNYIWPAMWGNKFYDDDSLNIRAAEKYGIVIGTSHHEPLMRAHDEWRKYGTGKWNYDSNAVNLKNFWRQGMERARNEKIVTVGMRGDGDEPMSRETATSLLERIVKDQRQIISETTGQPASETPQLWALYKEVQDYYDKGMRVPDDVTLLLCDDNWGNIRKLPKLNSKPRKGGYGIYYHFDYVGGPRNYKWLNTNPLPRIWEQMHLAWEYNAREIWIVNVGDIKPMEFPVSFFLDYAWNPDRIGAADLQSYTEKWAADQFGKPVAKEIADILSRYSKYNSRRKPELLDANTYDLASGEWASIVQEYTDLQTTTDQLEARIPPEYKDAFFQLVLHPVKANANLNQLYYNVALNRQAYTKKWLVANTYADIVKELFIKDSLITMQYHQLGGGKWNHLMDQTHIGYTYWQQPAVQKIPELKYVSPDSAVQQTEPGVPDLMGTLIPEGRPVNVFYQLQQSGVSINADHYTNAVNTGNIKWTVLPDHGRTGSAITAFPVISAAQKPGGNSPHLVYEIYTYGEGDVTINTYHSPSLNFQSADEGLQYAISIDDELPQVVSINKEDKNSISGIWNKWVAENIIIKPTKHKINKPGKHLVKYWMVDPGLVLQKIVLDFGDTEKTYLGPVETIKITSKN